VDETAARDEQPELRVQRPERADRHAAADHGLERAILQVALAQTVTVCHQRPAAAQRHLERLGVELSHRACRSI
jgi:hypothetical protein